MGGGPRGLRSLWGEGPPEALTSPSPLADLSSVPDHPLVEVTGSSARQSVCPRGPAPRFPPLSFLDRLWASCASR